MAKNSDQQTQQILAALDVAEEYSALGLDLNGSTPSSEGWIDCHAYGRDDRNASAGINVRTGRYKDHGGDGDNLSLWDFAVKCGRFADWKEARQYYADKVGVKLGGKKKKKEPDENLTFMKWCEPLVDLWCRHKQPVTATAVQAAGGQLARYRDQYTVIALPVYGPQLTSAPPCGYVLYNITGGPLPVFHRKGEDPTWEKMKTTGGSESGVMGMVDLVAITMKPSTVQAIWKTEGPSDMMALWSVTTVEERQHNAVICNSGGANEHPKPWVVDLFADRRAVVVHDADTPGQSGAEKWTSAIARKAKIVHNVRLPYEVQPKHGKDLRDYFGDGHTFLDLIELAKKSTPTDAKEPEAFEADDDPHRLAGVFLKRLSPTNSLRYWQEEWWQWDEYRYQKIKRHEIRARVTQSIKKEFDRLNIESQEDSKSDGDRRCKKVTRATAGNAIGAMEGEQFIQDATDQQSWIDGPAPGPSKNYIALQNGVLDLDELLSNMRKGVLDPGVIHDRSLRWFSPVCLPYEFDAKAHCPRWKSILNQNLEEDRERIELLQEWAGYLLTADTGQQKFMVHEGEGSNGKSVYCAAIEAMIGQDNTSHVPLEIFSQRFALTETLGKLVNIAADCGEIDAVAEGHLKSFTSGDRMFFDRKGIQGISATPTARMMMATNSRPRFSDKSSGIWRRMILVPWRIQIMDADKIRNMDKPQWWEASGELPGILNWAIAGLYRLRDQGHFTQSSVCDAALAEYRSESNPAMIFLADTCQESPYSSTQTLELYKEYRKWCDSNGYKPLGERMLGKQVKRQFPSCQKRRLGSDGDRVTVYEGIKTNIF